MGFKELNLNINNGCDRLLFPNFSIPDDKKDHTAEIIWKMRSGYRRHYGIVEQAPILKPKKRKTKKRRNNNNG